MVRRDDLKSIKNCKMIPGEDALTQHILVCVILNIRKEKKVKLDTNRRIKIWSKDKM